MFVVFAICTMYLLGGSSVGGVCSCWLFCRRCVLLGGVCVGVQLGVSRRDSGESRVLFRV